MVRFKVFDIDDPFDQLHGVNGLNDVADVGIIDNDTVGGSVATAGEPSVLVSQLQTFVNFLRLFLHSILDFFIPYTPPTPGTCSGPSVDGTCGSDDLVCRDALAEMCESVSDIPGVSTAFKKCMKGRCGCGGSSFPPARIICDSPLDCGPCGPFIGCNDYSIRIWFCNGSPDSCRCVNTVFHEMAHACGALHNLEYFMNPGCNNTDPACIIGDWFEEQCPGQ